MTKNLENGSAISSTFCSIITILSNFFQVLDYTQYYLDLESANSGKEGTPAWQTEYNLTTYYYGLGEISRSAYSSLSS